MLCNYDTFFIDVFYELSCLKYEFVENYCHLSGIDIVAY